MAKSKLPGFLKKKKLLDDPQLPASSCRTYGDLYAAAGLLADALDFYLKGNDAEGLARLEAQAVASGDAFLLERLLQAQGREAPELWQQVAAAAAAAGKVTLARWAQERCGQGGAADVADSPAGSQHAHDA
ncbi:MAG: hypothetical protein ACUVRZ_10160 [Desulfobacca sp.]